MSVQYFFGSYAVHKVVPYRVLIDERLNYFMTSLRGKHEVQIKFENSMHNYNTTTTSSLTSHIGMSV